MCQTVNGKRHCGQIEVEALVKKSEVRACHCTDCEKMSSTPFRAMTIAYSNTIKMRGHLKEYVKIGDDGNKQIQTFCEHCFTHLLLRMIKRLFLIS